MINHSSTYDTTYPSNKLDRKEKMKWKTGNGWSMHFGHFPKITADFASLVFHSFDLQYEYF